MVANIAREIECLLYVEEASMITVTFPINFSMLYVSAAGNTTIRLFTVDGTINGLDE